MLLAAATSAVASQRRRCRPGAASAVVAVLFAAAAACIHGWTENPAAPQCTFNHSGDHTSKAHPAAPHHLAKCRVCKDASWCHRLESLAPAGAGAPHTRCHHASGGTDGGHAARRRIAQSAQCAARAAVRHPVWQPGQRGRCRGGFAAAGAPAAAGGPLAGALGDASAVPPPAAAAASTVWSSDSVAAAAVTSGPASAAAASWPSDSAAAAAAVPAARLDSNDQP